MKWKKIAPNRSARLLNKMQKTQKIQGGEFFFLGSQNYIAKAKYGKNHYNQHR